jgi:hypothetical protein
MKLRELTPYPLRSPFTFAHIPRGITIKNISTLENHVQRPISWELEIQIAIGGFSSIK